VLRPDASNALADVALKSRHSSHPLNGGSSSLGTREFLPERERGG